MATLATSFAVRAAEAKVPPIGDAIGRVVCGGKALTTCQAEFCTVTFDTGDDTKFTFDFTRQTYIDPSLGPRAKPMQHVAVDQAQGTYTAKFGIDLPGGPANVEFLANRPHDGAYTMTAAKRFVYPPNGERPSIIVIDGLECRKAAN